MSTTYKYGIYLNSLATEGISCPPKGVMPPNGVAYRWTRGQISESCFLPVALRNPRRLLKAKEGEKCSCYGLSMHETLDQSVNAFRSLEKSIRQIRKTIGDAVSVGSLDAADGVRTFADRYGHFDLHEYANCSIATKFQVVKGL